jgi:hypothetical protein
MIPERMNMIKYFLRSGKISLIILGCALTIILGVYMMGIVANEPPGFLTEDPLQTAKMPFYTGLLSNLGAMFWAGAATCNLLSLVLVRGNRQKRWFFLASAAITIWLGVDDLFMLHDQVFRYYIPIPEKIIFLTYAALICGYLLYFSKDILATANYPILGIAMLFLASSMAMDALLPYSLLETFFEDCVKFCGIAHFLTYYFLTTINLFKPETAIAG